MLAVHRPVTGTNIAVAAQTATDPRSKTAVCARCGIHFKRTVRTDRPLKQTCRDCHQVAPRFAQGETHDHNNPDHRPTPARDTAPYTATPDR